MTERAIAFISLGAAALILVTTTLLGLFPITRALLVYYIFLTAAIYTLLYLVANRIELEAEKARAEQARKILRVAEQTLPYLRQGLDISSAQHVARIIFPETRAIAVAVTDRKKILAFVGEGEDHHYPGKKIITRATKTAIKESRSMVLQRKDEIGCPSTKCPLKAAIVMPIRHEGEAVGTIKFYYGKEGPVSDAEVALAEGLAHLLETQLELSKLSRLETLACQAELRALQAQISPHFFFNVLNTAIAYCRTDPLEARKLLMDFSSFFRATIEHGEETLITLDAELNYLATYLELEKARFGNRLLYTISVSRKALTWPIPPFTLQPIVENAINHGFPHDRPLAIEIKDISHKDLRIIEVRDNGTGIPAEKLPHVLVRGSGDGLGVGLSLINERLKLLFGQEFGLVVESHNQQGTTVRVVMPKKTRIAVS